MPPMVPGCTDGSRMQVLTEKDDFANSSKWYDGWRFMETEMPLTFEAIYENGVLKPAQPLPLKEHDKVRVTIESDLGLGGANRRATPVDGRPPVAPPDRRG
jgi:hypothetical protein